MLVKVLKPFPYAHDHMHVVTLQPDDIVEIHASVVEGLHAEGFIDEASTAEIEAAQEGCVVLPPPVEIPADWTTLHWFKLKALAEKLAGGPVANKLAAVALVDAELARRARDA
jgi:hypothetical protein